MKQGELETTSWMFLFLNGFICCTKNTISCSDRLVALQGMACNSWKWILGIGAWSEQLWMLPDLSAPLHSSYQARKREEMLHEPLSNEALCLFSPSFFISLSLFSFSTLSMSMYFLPCSLSLSLQMLPSLPPRIFSSCLMSLSSQAEPNAHPSHPTRWGVWMLRLWWWLTRRCWRSTAGRTLPPTCSRSWTWWASRLHTLGCSHRARAKTDTRLLWDWVHFRKHVGICLIASKETRNSLGMPMSKFLKMESQASSN